ncbi:hypothetical protein IMSHALPRED_011132 [Imshaugia aleurites]|uniref:Uncharacterized protein n=1 Tax=Imshaugia aleurites TaxID=172621 RepID=A0A8H3J084_9LECA|nr:hypothetical protein IMSHALPRED_011132 [Imshaugia aleurites]
MNATTAVLASSTATMTYVGPHTPGGESVTLSGTAKAIYKRFLALNPAFYHDDFDITREARNCNVYRAIKRRPTGQGCGTYPPYNQPAAFETIEQGISYFDSLPGNCGIDNSGVSRVSCSYDSAIYLVGDVKRMVPHSIRVQIES